MPPFFTLREMLSQTYDGPDDVLNVKWALNRIGFYDMPDYGMTPYADRTMFDGIRRIQRANGLRAICSLARVVTGVQPPSGPVGTPNILNFHEDPGKMASMTVQTRNFPV